MKAIKIEHPLLLHKLTLLRERTTSSMIFRQLVEEISILLAFEATKQLKLETREVTTPLEKYSGKQVQGKKLVLIPILRAGLGMVEGFLKLIPNARVGHIGLARNEITLKPEAYFFRLPEHIDKRHVILLDPMLATGGSLCLTLQKLAEQEITDVSVVCILSSPEGLARVNQAFPNVQIFTAEIDRELNDKGYILPGLGDAGDRIFATKT